MAAVLEAALLGERLDLGEDLRDAAPGVPQADPAQPGGVDEHPTVRQRQEVACSGGVPPLSVAIANGLYVLRLRSEQRVGERGLARPGLPEEYGRAPGECRGEGVDALPRLRADREDEHAGGGALGVGDEVAEHGGVGDEVCLGEHDQRRGPALPGQREEPFNAAEVEFDGQRHGDDRVVDVGGQDLALGPLAGGGPYERGAARQQRPYVPLLAVDGRPVAGAHDVHRVAGGDEGGVGLHGGEGVAVGHDEVAAAAVDAHDPAGHKPVGGVRREAFGEPLVPAVGRERVRGNDV